MMLSMTGFGKSEVTLDHFNVNIEHHIKIWSYKYSPIT